MQEKAVFQHQEKINEVLSRGLERHLFPEHLELTPNLNEVYELALAFYESQILTNDEIIQNGAYFARVGTKVTRHFLLCTGEPLRLPQHSSSRLKSFFGNNQFKTGYATHGLFPYRGKFHPQMIKALINIMGLKPGDTILDPMMGSGTVLIEASLMGIKSVGLDASPFCKFMSQTKLDALTITTVPLHEALKQYKECFNHFTKIAEYPNQEAKVQNKLPSSQNNLPVEKAYPFNQDFSKQHEFFNTSLQPEVYNLLLLAYLDSAGYAQRSSRKPPLELFRAILERYVFVVEKINRVLKDTESSLARGKTFSGDARSIPLETQTVEGILFSPPYSFAIDYIKNDSFHLKYMGENITELKNRMIGLRGKTFREKINLYMQDMDKVLSECARVLGPSRFCTIIVGTNDNQLSNALGVPREEVSGLHKIFINLASNHGFSLVRLLSRQIMGMANTMREEFIVILQRV